MLAMAQNSGAGMRYAEIPLSSREEKHVTMCMAINTTKQNQNKIF